MLFKNIIIKSEINLEFLKRFLTLSCATSILAGRSFRMDPSTSRKRTLMSRTCVDWDTLTYSGSQKASMLGFSNSCNEEL